jgi:hypothetical protein
VEEVPEAVVRAVRQYWISVHEKRRAEKILSRCIRIGLLSTTPKLAL